MRVCKSLMLSMVAISGLYAFDGNWHSNELINYNGRLSNGVYANVNPANIYRNNISLGDDNGICNRFILYTIKGASAVGLENTPNDNYSTFANKDYFGLLLSDILYAPAWLYRTSYIGDTMYASHCVDPWAGRRWFNGSGYNGELRVDTKSEDRRSIAEDKFKGYIVESINNDQSYGKYFDVKIANKYSLDVIKSVYLPSNMRFYGTYGSTNYVLSSSSAGSGHHRFMEQYLMPGAVTKIDYKYTFKESNKQIPFPNVKKGVETENELSIYGDLVRIDETVKRSSVDKFNENIHKFRLPGVTGVIDTYLTVRQGSGKANAATYFLTQDLDFIPDLLTPLSDYNFAKANESLYRKKDNGSKIFTPYYSKYADRGGDVKMMIDLSSVGLLNPQIFESVFYKSKAGSSLAYARFWNGGAGKDIKEQKLDYEKVYQTDVYTMHGDFLNRFITGFGPVGSDYNLKYKIGDDNPNKNYVDNAYYIYDGGWFSHRYLKDNVSYNSTSDSRAFGLAYDMYDPITTYIQEDGGNYPNVSGRSDTVYKQYAIDDPNDTSVDIHVRPLFAYAKKDGNTFIKSDDMMKRYGNGDVDYVLHTVFFPDPTDVKSLKPFAYGDITLGERADNAQVKVDMSDFKMDTWYGSNVYSKSLNSRNYEVFDKKTNTKKTIRCGWGEQYDWNVQYPPAVFVCDQPFVNTDEHIVNTPMHTYKTSYDEVMSGVDVLKLMVGDSDMPLRKNPFNDKGEDLDIQADIVSIYHGGYAYDFTKTTNKGEYYSSFSAGRGSYNEVTGGAKPGGLGGTAYMNNAGIKGKRGAAENNTLNAMGEAKVEFKIRYDNEKQAYIGNLKLVASKFKAILAKEEDDGNLLGTSFIVRLKNIKDPKTGRIVPFDKQFRIVLGEKIVDNTKVEIVSRKSQKEVADTIYTQVSGLVHQKQSIVVDSGAQFSILKKFDPKSSSDKELKKTMVKIILQKKTPNGGWEDLGRVIHPNRCTFNYWPEASEGTRYCHYSSKNFFDLGQFTQETDPSLIASPLTHYNLFEFGDDSFHFTLAPVGDIVYRDENPKDYGIYGSKTDKNTSNVGRVRYFDNKANKSNQVGVFRFKIHKIGQNDLQAMIKAEKVTLNKDVGAIFIGDRQAQGNELELLVDKYSIEVNSDEFMVRPGYAELQSVNGIDVTKTGNFHLQANKYHVNQELAFKFYNAEIDKNSKYNATKISSLIEQEDLNHIDLKLTKVALVFDLNRYGQARSYILNQKSSPTSKVIGELNPVNMVRKDGKALANVALKFPYQGNDVGVLGVVFAGNNGSQGIVCDNGLHKDKYTGLIMGQNVAIDGMYGCYPEPTLGHANFTSSLNTQCIARNQYAFLRDEDDALRYDNSGLYNVSFDCVKKYVDENNEPIYSVGYKIGCSDFGCNEELSTIKREKDWFDIKDPSSSKGKYNIWLYDTNYDTQSGSFQQQAEKACSHYKGTAEEWKYSDCVKNDILTRIQGRGDKYEYDYLNNSGNFAIKSSAMNARFATSIHKDLGSPSVDYQGVLFINMLKYFDKERKKGATPSSNFNGFNSLFSVDIDSTKYNQPYDNYFKTTNIGNTFAISMSKERNKQEPIYITEKLTDDPAVTDDSKSKGVLKYGVLEVNDILLKEAINDTKTVVPREEVGATFPISVYQNGKFMSVRLDNDFASYDKNQTFEELKTQVASIVDFSGTRKSDGYYVDDTRVVSLAYDIGNDSQDIGYMLKSKNANLSKESFSDLGVIYTNKNSNLSKILRPTSNTIKIEYLGGFSGGWQGIERK